MNLIGENMIRKLTHKKNRFPHGPMRILIAIFLMATQGISIPSSQSQKSAGKIKTPTVVIADSIELAVTNICEQRVNDKYRTLPIDEMAVQSPPALTDPRVIAGKKRAERLLPVVKRLLPSTLSRLAASYRTGTISSERVMSRLRKVTVIKPDVEELDNASVSPHEPSVITFGTIFLAGLRSDEAMIAVLAHELTHVVDGPEDALEELFMGLRIRASQISGNSIRRQPAIELACELVGLHVLADYLGRPKIESQKWRLARALQKNCVTHDLEDAQHLSPRQTLTMLLLLEPDLTRIIARGRDKKEIWRANDGLLF